MALEIRKKNGMVTKNEEVCQRRGNRRERKMIYIDQLFVQKILDKIRQNACERTNPKDKAITAPAASPST